MMAVVLLVLSAPPVARVDTSGHALATLQRGLEDALGAVNACRKPAAPAPPPRSPGWHEGKNPPKVVASSLPSRTRVSLAVGASGAVASVTLEDAEPFVAPCLERALIKLEFGPAPRDAVGTTLVTAELRCLDEACWWSWQPRAH